MANPTDHLATVRAALDPMLRVWPGSLDVRGYRRFFPWCQGAASEDNPEFCDDCWAAAYEGETAP